MSNRLLDRYVHKEGKIDVDFYRKCFKLYTSDVIYEKSNFIVDNYVFNYASLVSAVEFYINNYATSSEVIDYRAQRRNYAQRTNNGFYIVLINDYKNFLKGSLSPLIIRHVHEYIFSYATEAERNEFIDYIKIRYQRMFNIYVECNGDLSLIFQTINQIPVYKDFGIVMFVNCVKIYAQLVAQKELSEFQKKNNDYSVSNSQYYEVLAKLYNAKSDDEINNILSEFDKVYIAKLRGKISNFAIMVGKKKKLSYEKINAITDKLKKIFIKFYQQSENKTSSKSESFNEKFFMQFLLCETTFIDDYCQQIGISPVCFSRRLSYLKKENVELHQRVSQKIASLRKNYCDMLITKSVQFCYWINNGIRSNGMLRAINIVDFYLYFNISPKLFFSRFPGDKNNEVANKIRIFVYKHFYDSVMSEITIYNEENYALVNGQRRIVRKEEKEAVLSYIKEHNLPLNTGIYSNTLNMYLNNLLPTADMYNPDNVQYAL